MTEMIIYSTSAAPLTAIDRQINRSIERAHAGRHRYAMTTLDAIEADFTLRRAKIQNRYRDWGDVALDWRGMVRAGFSSY